MKDGEKQAGRETPAEPDRELVFYYSRERRLERASPEVRAINEGRPLIKGGFVRSLTSTKPHQILFVSVLLISVWILVFFNLSRGGLTLGGNTLRLRAGGGAEPFILVTKRRVPGGEYPYTGVVYVGVSPFVKSPGKTDGADIPVFTDQIFFTLEGEEEYRLDLPFSAEKYLLLFQAGEQRVSAQIKAGR
ncbi:MAG: hypothetical protein LBG14_07090 [Treponema sp.]|nr:hypothetical protein [Treponema sp.]